MSLELPTYLNSTIKPHSFHLLGSTTLQIDDQSCFAYIFYIWKANLLKLITIYLSKLL